MAVSYDADFTIITFGFILSIYLYQKSKHTRMSSAYLSVFLLTGLSIALYCFRIPLATTLDVPFEKENQHLRHEDLTKNEGWLTMFLRNLTSLILTCSTV